MRAVTGWFSRPDCAHDVERVLEQLARLLEVEVLVLVDRLLVQLGDLVDGGRVLRLGARRGRGRQQPAAHSSARQTSRRLAWRAGQRRHRGGGDFASAERSWRTGRATVSRPARKSRDPGRAPSGTIRKAEPYNVDMMSKSRLVPWLGFGAALVGGVRLVARRPSRTPGRQAAPAGRRRAGRGGRRRPDPPDRRLPRRRLGRDPGEQRLRRDPGQRLLGDGSPLPHRLRERRRGRGGAGQAGARSQRRERRLRRAGDDPARRGAA